ncbi:hypothetical protein QYE76_063942 [Lolium multiflorum]|uniref:VWFA domain-containing protein n=1 Tax=Lolium multiflorum TaxID=4521 RepID=A0AAD8S8C9_LOLMU|nr:hypothetical protein QYE76_063942 [Lolium multiflorum]
MDAQAAPASVLQLSIFTTVKSIPRPERYADFPVTVRLVAPGKEQTVRAPIDIVAAIDRSRSVNDDHRLEEEKAAVALLIRMLFPTDRLAIVPFDDGVAHDEEELVLMSADGKQKTRSTLNSLKVGNGTRLSKPLERAEKILMGRGDVDRPAFIILLSDGGDTTILEEKEWTRTSTSVLAHPAYPVHTFGFSGHNAQTMGYIATRTKGTYTPVDGAGGAGKFSSTVAGLVDKARSRLFSAVGVGAELAAVHPGVSLARIDSGDRKASIGGDARSGAVDVGALNAGETLEFTVYLDVPEGDADVETTEVLSVAGAYTQGWDGERVKLDPSVVSVERPVPPQPEPEPTPTPEPQPTPEPEPTPTPEPQPTPEPEPTPTPKPEPDCCTVLDLIDERLQYWCKVKSDLAAMYEKAEAEAAGGDCKCQCQVSAVLRESSLESVNRAMYQDIYTAVLHAIKLRECSTGTATEHGCDGGDKAVTVSTTEAA